MEKSNFPLPSNWEWSSDLDLSICAEIKEKDGNLAVEVIDGCLQVAIEDRRTTFGGTDYIMIDLDAIRAAMKLGGE